MVCVCVCLCVRVCGLPVPSAAMYVFCTPSFGVGLLWLRAFSSLVSELNIKGHQDIKHRTHIHANVLPPPHTHTHTHADTQDMNELISEIWYGERLSAISMWAHWITGCGDFWWWDVQSIMEMMLYVPLSWEEVILLGILESDTARNTHRYAIVHTRFCLSGLLI